MTTFPICSIERQFELKYRDETGNEPGYLIKIERKSTKKSLKTFVMRSGLYIPRESGGNLGKIDRSHLDYPDN